MNTKTIVTAVVALIVGFGAGYLLHPASTTTPGGFARGGTGTFTGGARGTGGTTAAGGFLTGTVAAEDSSSITLNTRDGSSHVVLLTPSTTVSKTVPGTLSDVSVGSNIMVIGTTNADGSVSATTIELRPAGAPTPTSQTTPTQQ